jgi:hypothetical protein
MENQWKQITRDELIEMAQSMGLSGDDLKVKSKFDELKEVRSAHKELEDQIKSEAILTLPIATDEQVHSICEAIERGDDDAKKLINHPDGFRINEYHEGLIEIAEGNREENINTDEAKVGFGKQITNAHRIAYAKFGRPNKTGKYAGKGTMTVKAYIG